MTAIATTRYFWIDRLIGKDLIDSIAFIGRVARLGLARSFTAAGTPFANPRMIPLSSLSWQEKMGSLFVGESDVDDTETNLVLLAWNGRNPLLSLS
jgi:hypothetical protein